jgi:hypothetical protein
MSHVGHRTVDHPLGFALLEVEGQQDLQGLREDRRARGRGGWRAVLDAVAWVKVKPVE